MPITQKQLADHLGVTAITISRALNDHPAVAVHTRRRIREAAHRLGYGGPTTWGAQALAARRYNRRMPTGVLAVMVTSEHNLPYFEELLYGLRRGCLLQDLSILISPFHNDGLPLMVEQGRVDGVFSFTSTMSIREKIAKLNLPMVALGFRDCIENELAVLPDSRNGAYMATNHLLALGHRRIAHITYRYSDKEAHDRRDGHLIALAEAGVPRPDQLVCDAVVNTRDYEIARIVDELFVTSPGVTAINCYNDWIAMLTIEALAKRGIRVPDDISVTGFDDLSTVSHFSPAISSVKYDRAQMGENAVQLLTQSSDLASEQRIVVLPVTFVARETTRNIIIN